MQTSLHNLHSAIPPNQIQPLPLFHLRIALTTSSNPQHPADVPRRSSPKLPHTQHTARIVRLLHSECRALAFDWCRIGVSRIWLRGGEVRSIGGEGEEGAVD